MTGRISGRVVSKASLLRFAASAEEVSGQHARTADCQGGDDKPRVGAERSGLDAGDDALDPRLAASTFKKRLVAAQLAAARAGSLSDCGALLERQDVLAQCAAGDHAQYEFGAGLAAEIPHLRRAEMAVAAEQEFDP
ncbi:hypothetical protein [Paracraurococcus lichenis]|uniref:Uncharacterized protein n=1 Tax=Paracraurococcus lichenis TaxID=3064888 RepID=A0ABT9E5L8_9PROT|nr:hypothetical protein [Paracraurococcus sp. LOR1-02]MDO9711443.1 hypothetical protein [Paracraurococcus sp. LOR1-02]